MALNAWWPRLYTLPQIKLVGKINALVTVLVVMGCSLLPEYSHKFFFLYLVPLFVFLSGGVDGMLRNLDFHRMSIPVEELRNAFFLDLAFQSIVYFFTTFFFILLPFKVFFAGADLRLHPLVMLLTGTFSYTIFASVFCFFFVLNSRITLKYDQNDYLYLSVLGCIFFVIKMAGMNPVFYIMMIALSVMSARVFYLVQIRFYQKKNFKVSGLIGLCAVFFSISCAWLFRYDINNPGFGPGQKYKGMFVFSDFMPKLSPHTVKSLTEETR